MTAYIIGYDLQGSPSTEYKDLIDTIKSIGAWWHHLDSTWIVLSELTAEEIANKLTPHLRKGDEILVLKSSGVAAWWGFNDSGSKWLKDNL